MLFNYFKIAWRTLLRNKAFSFINITGLAMGLACSLLIMLWVRDEKSVDAFHQNSKTLYQVYERNIYADHQSAGYATQGLLATELKRKISEIEYSSGFEYIAAPGTQSNLKVDDKIFKMTGFYAGRDFFKMFSFPLVAGSVETALHEPGSIAISEHLAGVFFGSSGNAIGKTIVFENNANLVVGAIFKNVPAQSSLQFDFLRNWDDFIAQNNWATRWGNTNPQTFIQLKANTNATAVESKIKDFIYNYTDRQPGFTMELALQPYAEKYLHSHFTNGYADGGRIEYVRLFSIIALFILLIACINFMNLSTARSAQRAKEVGLRKVIGALRAALIIQFLGEALLLALLSGILALAMLIVILPVFNTLTGKGISLPFNQPLFWMWSVLIVFFTGIVSGSYPALFLSALKPAKTLKGPLRFKGSAIFFRQGLVVFQFVLTIVLVVGTFVIYKQVKYIHTKNIGYDRENLVYIPIEGELIQKYALFKQQALQAPGVTAISKMRNSPTQIEHHTGDIFWEGKKPGEVISFADGVVGLDFVKTLKLELQAGRDFSPAYGMDSTSFILNEKAVTAMGLNNPIGATVRWGNRPGKVIGVLKDFHFNSIHQAIEPLILRLDENWRWGTIMVRVQARQTKEAVTALTQLAKELNPEVPFTYSFSDEEFLKLYRSEQMVERLSTAFATLAILISCLGLFGLAAFLVAQRNKEIGVRKVLGASVARIFGMLCGGFLRLIVYAAIIAFPIAYYATNTWLQHFEYKVDLTVWVFVAAGMITFLIALLTISYQSIQAALANPVNSIRTD